jgi:hypothetical protein
MAFRKRALLAIGGFDPQFRAAGDDVDVCWQLQEQGSTLGFDHGAMVWHHHRNSIRAYWQQQQGYGQAEAILERKWPWKYNVAGHLTWAGRLYGKGLTLPLGRTGRIYNGIWGLAPFQRLTESPPGLLRVLTVMPEWHLVMAVLGFLSAIGLVWRPLLIAAPVLVLAVSIPLGQAIASTRHARFATPPRSRVNWIRMHAMVALLHLVQPVARLRGRLRHGLTIWRQRGHDVMSLPRRRTFPLWVGRWQAPEERLKALQASMKTLGAVVLPGGDYDRWDLEVRGGLFGSSRLLMAVEDTGSGTQLVRLRAWPRCSRTLGLLLLVLTSLVVMASFVSSSLAAGALAALTALLVNRMVRECGVTMGTIERAIAACGLMATETAAETGVEALSRLPKRAAQPAKVERPSVSRTPGVGV